MLGLKKKIEEFQDYSMLIFESFEFFAYTRVFMLNVVLKMNNFPVQEYCVAVHNGDTLSAVFRFLSGCEDL